MSIHEPLELSDNDKRILKKYARIGAAGTGPADDTGLFHVDNRLSNEELVFLTAKLSWIILHLEMLPGYELALRALRADRAELDNIWYARKSMRSTL